MKKTVTVVLAAVLCAVLGLSVFSDSAHRVPSLFHNDEAWYKDEMAPALVRDGKWYVPCEVLSMFDYISTVSVRDGENLLFTNTETGDYLSVLVSQRAACVNGEIVEDVGVFLENRYCYIDAAFVCGCLGLEMEDSSGMAEGNKGISAIRIYDSSRMMSFEELFAAYTAEEESIPDETEESEDPAPAETEKEEAHPVEIYLICGEERDDEPVSAQEIAERLGFSYSLFLSPGSGRITALDLNNAIGFRVSNFGEAEAMNGRLEALYCRRTHFVLSTRKDEEDKKLMRAGYYVMKPDFSVEKTTDAELVFESIVAFGEMRGYVTIFLGNVWQTETLLMKLAELDEEQYEIGRIPGFN